MRNWQHCCFSGALTLCSHIRPCAGQNFAGVGGRSWKQDKHGTLNDKPTSTNIEPVMVLKLTRKVLVCASATCDPMRASGLPACLGSWKSKILICAPTAPSFQPCAAQPPFFMLQIHILGCLSRSHQSRPPGPMLQSSTLGPPPPQKTRKHGIPRSSGDRSHGCLGEGR